MLFEVTFASSALTSVWVFHSFADIQRPNDHFGGSFGRAVTEVYWSRISARVPVKKW